MYNYYRIAHDQKLSFDTIINLLNMQKNNILPIIIWVASRPPIPPFSGLTAKTLCGISALSAMTRVEVITFAEPGTEEESARRFAEYWGGRVARVHWLAYGRRPCELEAAFRRRFQFGLRLERSRLAELLADLEWKNPRRLLVFDDIVLAPFMDPFGENALLSPHDCISRMSQSHFRSAPWSSQAPRYLLQSLIACRYERSYYHRALLVHVITQRDRVWLEEINPKARYEVVANDDLCNPGFSKSAPNAWDVLVWGNLQIGSIAQGAKAFLTAVAQDRKWFAGIRLLVVGRATTQEAQKIIGGDLLSLVTYAPYLEDDRGQLQHAKITVIPDAGGAGIKNRCVNILSSGKCLACLYQQMEGIEKACDRGAINAANLIELAARVKKVLCEKNWSDYAQTGQAIFRREYGESVNRQMWADMVERAVAIRTGLKNRITE